MKRTLKRRQIVFVITAVALCTAVAFGIDYRQRLSPPRLSDQRSAGISNSVEKRNNVQREAAANPGPQPQSGAGFDLSRNVIAGGGGSSTGSGNLQVDGTVGQAAAGTTLSNGQFSVTGGFGNRN